MKKSKKNYNNYDICALIIYLCSIELVMLEVYY